MSVAATRKKINMSRWSYITGWVRVMPMGRTQEEKDYILKTVLNHLPVVQGSEEDMYVHIIKAAGHDTSCGGDEYGYRSNNLFVEGYGVPYRSRDGWLRYQSVYYLFIEGHLRDREFDWTYRQFIKWLTRLAKRIDVADIDVVVSDSWGEKSIRVEQQGFDEMFELPSWAKNRKEDKYISPYEDYDYNWCEHLMWE